jgi:thiol-disulfide isomerase/thioredoxin
MKLLLLILLTGCLQNSQAQADPGSSVLQNIQQLPSFTIIRIPDSTDFRSETLEKGKPVIIMFFNPDCDHCQKEAKELLAYKEELKDIQVVMLSPASFIQVKTFYEAYNMAAMPNVTMGLDVNYVMGLRYRPTNYPALFIYDAAGKLAKAFVGNVGVPKIIDALK